MPHSVEHATGGNLHGQIRVCIAPVHSATRPERVSCAPSQVRTRRRAAKREATIIEVYRNGSSGGGSATLGAYDPERREVEYGVTGRKNMGFSTGGVKNRIRRERKRKKK